MSKIYAVRKGRICGLFQTWKECQDSINGFSGAEFKSFKSIEDAKHFLGEEMKEKKEEREIYTDGSCSNQVGGYGCFDTLTKQELYGKVPYNPCTNNIAELYAILVALKTFAMLDICIVSDSRYAINCLSEWHKKWINNGWKTQTGNVENRQLIEECLNEMKNRNVIFKHVYGHCGNPNNEQVDKLANIGRLL
jgi:ribonuclease HI